MHIIRHENDKIIYNNLTYFDKRGNSIPSSIYNNDHKMGYKMENTLGSLIVNNKA